MLGIIKNLKRTIAMLKISIIVTLLLGAFAILLILLPDNLRTLKLILGILCLSIFVVSWVLTFIFFKQTVKPVKEIKDVVSRCVAKYKGAKDKIMQCMMVEGFK